VVISTDLSHYLPYQAARKADAVVGYEAWAFEETR